MTNAKRDEPRSQQTKPQGGYDYAHYVEDYCAHVRSQSLEDFETAYKGTLSRLDFSEGSRVLDVGGGAGQLVALLARRGCSATLLDVSEGGVALAKEICAKKLSSEEAQRISFVVGDLSFGGAPASLIAQVGSGYDVIILRQVWEHLTPDQCDATINNCRTLLARTGYIYIETEPNASLADFLRWAKRTFLGVHGGYKEDGIHINEQTLSSLRRTLARYEWADSCVRPYFGHHWLYKEGRQALGNKKQKVVLPLIYVISTILNVAARIPILTPFLCYGSAGRLTLRHP